MAKLTNRVTPLAPITEIAVIIGIDQSKEHAVSNYR
jgi:hypothetical protein